MRARAVGDLAHPGAPIRIFDRWPVDVFCRGRLRKFCQDLQPRPLYSSRPISSWELITRSIRSSEWSSDVSGTSLPDAIKAS